MNTRRCVNIYRCNVNKLSGRHTQQLTPNKWKLRISSTIASAPTPDCKHWQEKFFQQTSNLYTLFIQLDGQALNILCHYFLTKIPTLRELQLPLERNFRGLFGLAFFYYRCCIAIYLYVYRESLNFSFQKKPNKYCRYDWINH